MILQKNTTNKNKYNSEKHKIVVGNSTKGGTFENTKYIGIRQAHIGT